MTEQGSVTKVQGKKAWVTTIRSSACDSCGAKAFCHTLGGDNKQIEIEALNTANAKVGNIVNIELRSSTVLKSAFLVYIVPIIFLFIGIIIGDKLGQYYNFDKEKVSLIAGFGAFVISFICIKLISIRLSKKREYIPEITKIMN